MHRRLISLIVLSVFLVSGVGCRQKAEEAPKGPIRIGGSLSLTGRFAEQGNYMHQGYQLWAKHVNAKGGLLGRPVELLIYDDKSDRQTSVYKYQQLLLEDKVDLVLGPYSTHIAAIAGTVTEKLGYPMIAYATSEDLLKEGFRYVFGFAPPATHWFDGALAIAKQQGLKRIALLNENTNYPHSVALGTMERAREMGLQLVFREEYQRGTEDFRWRLREIKALKPDVLITAGFLEEKLITRQLKQVDFMPNLYVGLRGTILDQFGTDLGPDAEYVLGGSAWEPYPQLGFPGMQQFIEDFQKEFGRLPTEFTAVAYAIAQVLEAAVTKVGSLDREKIRDAMAGLDMVTVYGRYKLDEDGFQIGKDVLLIQWQKGKKEIVWPEAYATAKLIYPIPPWHARKGR